MCGYWQAKLIKPALHVFFCQWYFHLDRSIEQLMRLLTLVLRRILDSNIVTRLGLPVTTLSEPISVSALDGAPHGNITHKTKPLMLIVFGSHPEQNEFFLFPMSNSLVILGFPWLAIHNSHIHWSWQRIESWSPYCLSAYILHYLPLASLAQEYHDLSSFFSKDKALTLPLHRPYDCAIDLQPEARVTFLAPWDKLWRPIFMIHYLLVSSTLPCPQLVLGSSLWKRRRRLWGHA